MSYVLIVAAGAAATTVAVTAGVKYGVAKHNAKKDAKNRPKYNIPAEISQNLTQAQQQALQGLPEEQKQQFIDHLQRGSAQALASSATRKGGLAGIAGINQEQNDQYGKLMAADAVARQQNLAKLQGARQTMADYKDQSFQFNVVNPYYEQIKAREERNNALAQGITDSAGVFASGVGGGKGKAPSKTTQKGQTEYPQLKMADANQTPTSSPATNPYGDQELDMTGSQGSNIWGKK